MLGSDHAFDRSFSQPFAFFLAGFGRGQDVRSITQGRIAAAQLSPEPHPRLPAFSFKSRLDACCRPCE